MEEQKKSNSPKIIIGILLLVVAVLAYMLTSTKGELSDVGQEKERLIFDLEQMKSNLEDRESENDSLDAYIVAEIARLQMVIDSVESVNEADAKAIKRYKNSVWAYKQREKKFISQIDSINAAYEVMRMEKEKAEMNLFEEQQRNMELNAENRELQRDVAVGSMLQATTVEAKGVKVYKSGKLKETVRARRATRITTCATIAKNPLAEAGTREVYVRITTSENTVLAAQGEDEKSFEFNGQPLIYSAKAEVDYQNENTMVCVNFDKEDFAKGEYNIEMFTEGYKVGETKLTLK
ncbi:MAG: hypothetical protein N4A46_10940 [Schleiferiaceae bacterium]|jgi:hypothetical protein|nr:hypothetical protein [Schleiferiaceae bacterium]